jgi:hypothetical protein
VQADIADVVLWLFIFILGIATGAGIYEARIVVPLWGSAPPQSLHSPDSGRRFWAFFTTVPLTLLVVAGAAAVLIVPMDELRRLWWGIGLGLVAVERIATFAYFIPTIIRLQRAEDFAWQDVRRKFAVWRMLNYGRIGLTLFAWIAALKALMPH